MLKVNAAALNAELIRICDIFRVGDADNTDVIDLLAAICVTFTMRKVTDNFDVEKALRIANFAVQRETSPNTVAEVFEALFEASASLATEFNLLASAGE